MGNFYTNYTLRGPSQFAVAAAMTGRTALITPVQAGCVVVFDELSEVQDAESMAELASTLSRRFRCPVFGIANHDDDILCYQLYQAGAREDEYDSCPNFFDPDAEPAPPAGGDATKLCAAFGCDNVVEVEGILRRSGWDEEGYTFEVERHQDLVLALGLPAYGVGAGYLYVSRGELPDGLASGDLLRVE
jgi:hypothetical protein